MFMVIRFGIMHLHYKPLEKSCITSYYLTFLSNIFKNFYISTYIQDILADFFLKKRTNGSALK